MNKKKILILLLSFVFIFLVAISLTSCFSSEPAATSTTDESERLLSTARTIKVVQIEGSATVTDTDGEINCFKGMNLYDGDKLDVKADSTLVVKFDDDKYVYLGENTTINLRSEGKDKYKTNVFVEKGKVLAEIQNQLGEDEEFFLSSNNSVMAVRGTVFGISVVRIREEIIQKYSVYRGVTELYLFDTAKNGNLIKGKISDIQNSQYEVVIPESEVLDENNDYNQSVDNWLSDVDNDFDNSEGANEELEEVQITVGTPSKEEYQEIIETVGSTVTYSNIDYKATGYYGEYDGEPHSIDINVEEKNAKILYKTTTDGEYSETKPTFTTPGYYRTYYKITCDGYTDKEDYAVVQISKAYLSALENVELTINTPLIVGTPLAQALKDVDLLEYYKISGVEKDDAEMANATFDLSGTLEEGTNNYRVEVILPNSIKDYYDTAYIDVELTTQELIVAETYCISDGNLLFSYVYTDDLNKYNGIKETSLFDELVLKAGSVSITRSTCKNIKFTYDYLVEGYFEIVEGKNEVGVEIEFEDYTITTTASFNVNDTRYVPEIVITPDSNFVTSLGGNKYNFTNISDLPYENGEYTITGEMLYEAFGLSSNYDVIINFDKNANDEIVDYDLYNENGTFTYKEEELLPLEFRILPTNSRKSASLSLYLYFAETIPAEYPTYEISDNLVYKYSATGTVINDAVTSTFPVKYSLDDVNYEDSVTITEVGTYTVYFMVGTDNAVKDSIKVIIKASKISSDSLGFIQDEVSLISNDNGHIIEYERSISEGSEPEVLKASDNTVISPFDDVYTVYTNIVLNGEYYDSVTKEPLPATVTVSPKVSGSADFTYSISCDGYETIEGECKFVYTEIGEVGSTLVVTNPSDLEISMSDLSSVYATEPTFNLSSVNSDVSDSIYYSIDNGKTWTTESPLLSGVGTYTIYSIFCAYYSGTPFTPVGKEPTETYHGLSANGNFLVSIQTIVITE